MIFGEEQKENDVRCIKCRAWEFRFLHSCGLGVHLYRKMGLEDLHDSFSVLLTDLASCLFSSGRWFRGLLGYNGETIVIETAMCLTVACYVVISGFKFCIYPCCFCLATVVLYMPSEAFCLALVWLVSVRSVIVQPLSR